MRQESENTTRVRLRSPAKINLDLRVLGKRPDGYHDIRTIFQTVSLADTIEIAYAPARRLEVHIDSKPPIPGNLVEKALEALAIPGHFTIRLAKRIPMGAGLGGGSSNAAAMLLAIPVLTGRRIALDRLLVLAEQLGSDVGFFLFGGTALGLGRGTELYPLPDAKASPAIVVAPGIHVSTADAYRALNRGPSSRTNATEDERPANDFEAAVFRQHPRLKAIVQSLRRGGADLALMTGSGSSLFGIFPESHGRDSAAASLRKQFPDARVFPVSLVSRQRYRSLWRRQLGIAAGSDIWPPAKS